MKPLEEVLVYRNKNLINLFARRQKINVGEAEIVFHEVKKMLWFMARRRPDAGPFPIFSEQRIMDECWHEFILMTKDYHAFCEDYLGRYIHHLPGLDGIAMDDSGFGIPAVLAVTNREEYVGRKIVLLRKAMTEVAEILGTHTVRVWYEDIPRKYFYALQRTR